MSTPALVSSPPSSSSEGRSSTSLPSPVSQLPGSQSPGAISPATAHLSTAAPAATVACSTLVTLCSLLGVAWLMRRALKRRKVLATQSGDEGDAGGSGTMIPLGPLGHKTEPSQRTSEIDTPFPPKDHRLRAGPRMSSPATANTLSWGMLEDQRYLRRGQSLSRRVRQGLSHPTCRCQWQRLHPLPVEISIVARP